MMKFRVGDIVTHEDQSDREDKIIEIKNTLIYLQTVKSGDNSLSYVGHTYFLTPVQATKYLILLRPVSKLSKVLL